MRIFTRTALALSIAMGIGLTAGSASATQQAVVQVTYALFNPVFFPPTYYGYPVFPSGFIQAIGTGTATLNTTAGTPTPSVMLPAGIATQSTVSFTAMYAYTPYSTRTSMLSIGAATLKKSWAGAAMPTPNGGGLTTAPVPGNGTTICFASVGSVMPGPPALPNSCFPRTGVLQRAPGPKRFGGSARLLGTQMFVFSRTNFVTGMDLGTFILVGEGGSPMLAGPSSVSNYGALAWGVQTNTILKTTRTSFNTRQAPPFTTGSAMFLGGNYGTSTNRTGSHNLNLTNLTGSISLVKPTIGRSFSRQGGVYTGGGLAAGWITDLRVTFLPEPGMALLLGGGILGLAWLATRRRR